MARLVIPDVITVTGAEFKADHTDVNPGFQQTGPYHSAPIDLAGYKWMMAGAEWSDPWPDNGGGEWGDQLGVQYTFSHKPYTGTYTDEDRYGDRIPFGDENWAPYYRDAAQAIKANGDATDPTSILAKFFRTRQLRGDLVQHKVLMSPAAGYGTKDYGSLDHYTPTPEKNFYGVDQRWWEGQSYEQKFSPLGAAIRVDAWPQVRASLTVVSTNTPPDAAFITVKVILWN